MKRNSIIFIVLFVFFIVVAVGALLMLDPSHSVLSKDARSLGAQTAVMSKTVVGEEPTGDVLVPDTISETATEEVSVEEVVEEATTEATEVADTGDASGAGAEGTGAEAIPVERYFTFKTSTTRTVLNFRKEPSENAKVLWKLAPGTFGYILLPGNEWCKVALENGEIGYCATEYLDMTEVTRADFPEEFAAMVEISEEKLDY